MRKKILFVIESLVVGGAEKVLIDLVNGMDSHKFEINVLSIFRKSVFDGYDETFEDPFNPDISYSWLCDNNSRFKYKIFNWILCHFPILIAKYISLKKNDTVIAFYEGAPTRLISYMNNCRKMAWLHTEAGLSLGDAADEDVISEYEKYDKIIAVSERVKQSFLSKTKWADSKCIVLHNPIISDIVVEKSFEEIKEKRTEKPLFVSVGRLSYVKGYDRLIKAASRLKNEGHEFVLQIIGNGVLMDDLKRMCKDLNVEDCIELSGNKKNPYPYIKRADWFICSSRTEGYGIAVAEALILGVPVLSVDCGEMNIDRKSVV